MIIPPYKLIKRHIIFDVLDDLIAQFYRQFSQRLDAHQSAEVARKTLEILSSLPDFSHQTAEPPMRAYVESSGLNINQVFGILRVAVTGQKVSPPLFESMEIIGRAKVVERLRRAIELLEKI